MKKTILLLAAIGMSTAGFAQKDEIKAANKALKSGDAAAILSALDGAASTIDNAEAKYVNQFYFLQGEAYAMQAKAGDFSAYDKAVAAYTKAMESETASGKTKYTADIKQKFAVMTSEIVNAAVSDNNEENFKDAAEKLFLSYSLSPQDTIYLYYAASSAVNGNEYDLSLKYYNMLKDINYDGSEEKFSARNIETGEREEMPKSQRDLMVKSGAYDEPKDERTPSKFNEIIKNIALIYTQLGEDDKAMSAYVEAREVNPNDVGLILNQANLYFKQGEKEKFKSLMNEATELDPTNPDLFYNIGVINMEQGNPAEARTAYQKAIDLSPTYINAYLNLSTSFVNEGNALIDEMNKLGSSRKDIARYDELKAEKQAFFIKAAEALEAGLAANANNTDLLGQLKNIYGALGDNVNYMRVKKLLEE